jgi:exodeoxyribonuclease V alpha subunit
MESHNPQWLKLAGVVERVTFHSAESGWSVLRVSPYGETKTLHTVVVHQVQVFAGSSMEFHGEWVHHPKFGEQFKAYKAIQKKPASSKAMEKYLGSGLIKGVGPKTAQKIVNHFKEKTLAVFEKDIDELLNVPGIAQKKLAEIKDSWEEHKAVRDVMLFLQEYGISTLFAVKIFKTYGKDAITILQENPYRLSKDIYGIGFFSADRIALKMGLEPFSAARREAGIKHILASAREEGHCYLHEEQILELTTDLLQIHNSSLIKESLLTLWQNHEIKKRELQTSSRQCYYAKSLYFDEETVATKAKHFLQQTFHEQRPERDHTRIQSWVKHYCEKNNIQLSEEQERAVIGIPSHFLSVLTGGPGCGKTTTTKVLYQLLLAMKKKVILAAPTGRAAQRMSEVIGAEAKTIHRLLAWAPEKNQFKHQEDNPLDLDFLILDECSMLDISLAASVFKALPSQAQLLMIGDPDQLPSVGPGHVLNDFLRSSIIPSFRLTKIFRQAQESSIIRFAHQINKGEIPEIDSPFHRKELWNENADCLFIDAEEATQEQLQFIARAKNALKSLGPNAALTIRSEDNVIGVLEKKSDDKIEFRKPFIQEFSDQAEMQAPVIQIPPKFKHVNWSQLQLADSDKDELKAVLKKIHPWSALHYGFSATEILLHLYTKTIPNYWGAQTEIQILSPQIRGTLGTHNLNHLIQKTLNPPSEFKACLVFGERVYREGDRVIQTKNNYDLGVYNGDIGYILKIDQEAMCALVQFGKLEVMYQKEDLIELNLAYAITIHKSQGSEFPIVIIPVATQHFKMLFRNLIYTGLTRGKKCCVFLGSRKALSMAIKQIQSAERQTALCELLQD